MKKWGESLVIALAMYSAIPMPRVDWRQDNMRWSLGCLPVVGVLAGGLLYGWARLALWLHASPFFFAVVAVALPLLVSGGLHMDGFLDATDAIFSRRDREKKLQIMKDPHCGPFAVLSCAGLLLLEGGAWCQLYALSHLLPAACSAFILSRSLTVAAGSRFAYAPSSTLGALFADRAASGVRALGAAEVVGSVLLLLGAGFLGGGLAGMLCAAVAAAGSLLLFLWYRRMIHKQFGGVTGDLLGYFVELSQLLLLLLLAFGGLIASAVLR
ncbi:MAG TPA: adenosylcobinamide-GDP ribazoletransferase [Firmicutes bacterium]|nr:adenosylcobinamide-GDP ribazoletransferase [Bacillota bacterium]